MAVNKLYSISGMNGTDHNIRREALPIRGNDSSGTRIVTLYPLNLPSCDHPAAIASDDTNHRIGQRAAASDYAETTLVIKIGNKRMGIEWCDILLTGIKRTDSRKHLPQRVVAHHIVDNFADTYRLVFSKLFNVSSFIERVHRRRGRHLVYQIAIAQQFFAAFWKTAGQRIHEILSPVG